MSRLYEKFLLEYFIKEHKQNGIKASASHVDWNYDSENSVANFLPTMKSDVTLEKDGKILIIDAKYYEHVLQSQYQKKSIHSGNLYQIYTYVKNKDVKHTGNVAGMLLYAKTNEETYPNDKYLMDGNWIAVRTLDLDTPFEQIAKELDDIVYSYFG